MFFYGHIIIMVSGSVTTKTWKLPSRPCSYTYIKVFC